MQVDAAVLSVEQQVEIYLLTTCLTMSNAHITATETCQQTPHSFAPIVAPSSGSSVSLLSVAAAIVGCHQTPKLPLTAYAPPRSMAKGLLCRIELASIAARRKHNTERPNRLCQWRCNRRMQHPIDLHS